MSLAEQEVDMHKHNLRRQYEDGTISEAGLVTLASYDKVIALESGAKAMKSMGVDHSASLQPDGALWIAVRDQEDSDLLKSVLKRHGYTNLRTFEGWMGWCPNKRLILQASKTRYFDDEKGRGKKLLSLTEKLGVNALYVQAFAGQLIIDIDNESHAVAIYESLKGQGLTNISVQPDSMSSTDVWQVRCIAQ